MKDGFDKTIRGIELLKKYKIDVKINGSLVKKNFHDRIGRIYRKDYCGRTVFCLTENESGEKRGNKLQ